MTVVAQDRDRIMSRKFSSVALVCLYCQIATVEQLRPAFADETASSRPIWTTSKIVGSPEPPPPLKQVVRYPGLKFNQPLYIERDPANHRMWVVTRDAKVFSFPDDASVKKADSFVDLRADFEKLVPHDSAARTSQALALVFHPDYPSVPVCWMCYTLAHKQRRIKLEDGTRLSRFNVTFDDNGIPKCDTSSERVLFSWLQGGHNGCSLKFGPDGYLYGSAGDGEVPTPPDPRRNGQDVTNLMSTIFRIDANPTDTGPLYSIPEDNPFSKQSLAKIDPASIEVLPNQYRMDEARPEIFAYGFRNPWRMNFGPDGQLWVGDVGWELYEMVYNVKSGANYGWSIIEGPHTVIPDAKRGPTPIRPYALAYSHSEGASVTGGFVYQGRKFPELRGKYVFGDYETRRIWSSTITPQPNGADDTLTELTDLVTPSVRIVAFGEDTSGELLLLHFDEGKVYGLERNDAVKQTQSFPTKLSQTGLFRDTAQQTPAVGVMPFDINEPMWDDGAQSVRYVALPSEKPLTALPRPIRMKESSLREYIRFPENSVVARTVTLPDDTGRAVRLETQILHFNGRNWNPYSYVWNTNQTDASLADAGGQQLDLSTYGHFVARKTWNVHSRSECVRCHNSWVGGVLAFTLPQLNMTPKPDGHGAITQSPSRSPINQLAFYRETGMLTVANLDKNTPAMVASSDQSKDLNSRARSYLAANCAHCHQKGAGGTATIDLRYEASNAATKTIGATPVQGTFQIADASIITKGAPWKSVLVYRAACSGRGRMPHIGSELVDKAGVKLLREWVTSLDDSQMTNGPTPSLASTSAALELVAQFDRGEVAADTREDLLKQARDAKPEIANLLARFQPLEYQEKRNRSLNPATLLTLLGNADAGAKLFADKRNQCINCHRVANVGGQIGPALDGIAKRLKRHEILESLLDPSKKIAPKFAAWTALTVDGKVHAGLMVDRSEQSVILRSPKNENITIAREDIDELFQQTVSLMPDRLLNDLTDQQIADLLEYLATR